MLVPERNVGESFVIEDTRTGRKIVVTLTMAGVAGDVVHIGPTVNRRGRAKIAFTSPREEGFVIHRSENMGRVRREGVRRVGA